MPAHRNHKTRRAQGAGGRYRRLLLAAIPGTVLTVIGAYLPVLHRGLALVGVFLIFLGLVATTLLADRSPPPYSGPIPSPPKHFVGHGHIEARRTLGQVFTSPGFYGISGPPGGGKSALARLILHSSASSMFKDRKFYVDLDQVVGSDTVRAAIMQGMGIDRWQDVLSILGSHKPAILVLDNAEMALVIGPGETDPVLKELEAPTRRSLRVLVACRGHERLPEGIGWVRAVEVGALSSSDAMKLLAELAPTAMQYPQLDVLLQTWGQLPLAVTLLGRLVATCSRRDYDHLVVGLDELRQDGNPRANDLVYSLELTTKLLTPREKEALGLLACLPDGVHPDHATELFADIRNPNIRIARLYRLGLLENATGRFRCLPPIREFVLDADGLAPTPAGSARLFASFGRLLDAALVKSTEEKSSATLRQLGNIAAALQNMPEADRLDLGLRLVSVAGPSTSGLAEVAVASMEKLDLPIPAEYAGIVSQAVSRLRVESRWSPAQGLLRLLLSTAVHLRDHHLQANALHRLGEVARLTDHYPEAEAFFNEALAICREIGDRQGEADGLSGLGRVAELTGHYREAEGFFNEALAICREISDRPGEAVALSGLGRVAELTGHHPGIDGFFKEALEIYRAIGDRLGEANVLRNLGEIAWLTDHNPQAEGFFNEALTTYREVADRRGEANALHSLGQLAWITDRFPDAEGFFKEALEIYRANGDRRGEANALNSLGLLVPVPEHSLDAEGFFKEALEIYRDIGSRQGEANALRNLGDVARLTDQFPDAEGFFKEALESYRAIGDLHGQANTLSSLGALARLPERSLDAEGFFKGALEIYRDVGSRLGEANALRSLRNVARLTDRFPEAEDFFNEALAIYQDIGSRQGEADTLYSIGLLLRKMSLSSSLHSHNSSEARSALERAGELYALLGHADLLRACLDAIQTIADRTD